jgi:hypothetical protein
MTVDGLGEGRELRTNVGEVESCGGGFGSRHNGTLFSHDSGTGRARVAFLAGARL